MTKAKYPQDADEIKKMLDYYAANNGEVYSLTCLNCKRVIAVEIAPVKADGIVLEKGRTLYTVGDLCLSVRRREDLNELGQNMYGYQCTCGNNTILAKIEKGEVAERTIVMGAEGIVKDSGAIAASSPYELAQVQEKIKQKQADSKAKADYEPDGNKERFETFVLERVK
jgi:hypothetical protein